MIRSAEIPHTASAVVTERHRPFAGDDLTYLHFPAGKSTGLPEGFNALGFSSVYGVMVDPSEIEVRIICDNFNLLVRVFQSTNSLFAFLDQVQTMFPRQHVIHQLALREREKGKLCLFTQLPIVTSFLFFLGSYEDKKPVLSARRRTSTQDPPKLSILDCPASKRHCPDDSSGSRKSSSRYFEQFLIFVP